MSQHGAPIRPMFCCLNLVVVHASHDNRLLLQVDAFFLFLWGNTLVFVCHLLHSFFHMVVVDILFVSCGLFGETGIGVKVGIVSTFLADMKVKRGGEGLGG